MQVVLINMDSLACLALKHVIHSPKFIAVKMLRFAKLLQEEITRSFY